MSSNKTIAKNALFLYVRTIITTLVGIYTSRVVLQTLGVEDYGLYSVVGGVVGMFGFINASMSGTTSRFITFELGRGDAERLKNTFSSALVVHLCISMILLILAETVGLWFLCNKLVVPDGRMWAAHWVYQLSILSTLLGITQAPYDACMVAHERFDIYAYLSMFSTFAKLGILYVVNWLPFDNLITYAVLILIVSYGTRIYARVYCIRHFREAKFSWVFDKAIFLPMLSFSGWQMFGNLGVTIGQQGKALVVNMFHGVATNASVGIGTTVSGSINGLAYNVIQAFQPSITKSYASGNHEQFENMVEKAAFFSFLLFAIFSIPLSVECRYVLSVWLGQVPQYSTEICMLHLIFANLMMFNIVLNYALQAMGKNRKQNLFSSSVNICVVFIMYIMMRAGCSFILAYAVTSTNIVFVLGNVFYLYYRNTSVATALKFLRRVVLYLFVCYSIHYIILYKVSSMFEEGFLRLVVICFLSVILAVGILAASAYRETLLLLVNKSYKKIRNEYI